MVYLCSGNTPAKGKRWVLEAAFQCLLHALVHALFTGRTSKAVSVLHQRGARRRMRLNRKHRLAEVKNTRGVDGSAHAQPAGRLLGNGNGIWKGKSAFEKETSRRQHAANKGSFIFHLRKTYLL